MRICNPGVAGEYIFAILSLPDKFVQSGRNPVHLNICDAIIAHWLCINTGCASTLMVQLGHGQIECFGGEEPPTYIAYIKCPNHNIWTGIRN